MDDKVRELLGEELAGQVAEKLGDVKLIVDDGTLIKKDGDDNWIPKHRFDEVNKAKKVAEDMNKKYQEDMKELKKSAGDNEDLKSQIASLERANKAALAQAEKEALALRKSMAVNVAFMDAGVADPTARELLSKSVNLESLELDDTGKPKGFDEILKPIKENKTFAGMFGAKKVTGQEHSTGDSPTPLNQLQKDLDNALKSGNTAQVVAIKRKLAAESLKERD